MTSPILQVCDDFAALKEKVRRSKELLRNCRTMLAKCNPSDQSDVYERLRKALIDEIDKELNLWQ